jgi:thiamine pyrophosphokinase
MKNTTKATKMAKAKQTKRRAKTAQTRKHSTDSNVEIIKACVGYAQAVAALGLLGQNRDQNQRRCSGLLRVSYMRPIHHSPQNTL